MKAKLVIIILLSIVKISMGQTFVNPISPNADPYIYYDDSVYYYMGSANTKITIYKSKTLEGLRTASPITVFDSSDGGPLYRYWAPELYKYNGKWYIYFTAAKSFTPDPSPIYQRSFVIENTSADPTTRNWVPLGETYSEGGQTMGGLIKGDVNVYSSIDATVWEFNNKRYLLWAGSPELNINNPKYIYIEEMVAPDEISGTRVEISRPELSWEGQGVNEGPSILHRNGKVFMVYSTYGCTSPDYQMGMVVMNENSDPLNSSSWTKHPNPVFHKDANVYAYGTGHHGFFKSPDGTQDWFAYNGTNDPGGDCGPFRSVRAQQFFWNADGTPNFGIPSKMGIPLVAPSGEAALPTGGPVASGIYKIKVKATSKVFDLQDCSLYPSANVRQWNDNGLDCQKWNVQYLSDGYYTISSLQSGLLLDVENCSTVDLTNVRVRFPNGWNCQRFNIVDNGDGSYRMQFKVDETKVLTINTTTNNLEISTWSNTDNQKFIFEQEESSVLNWQGNCEIVSKSNNKAMTVPACSTSDLGLTQWGRSYNLCQQWKLEQQAGGYYKILKVTSGKVVTVPSGNQNPGVQVIQSSWTGADNQLWSIALVSGGNYKIISKSTGLALEVAGCSSVDGAQLVINSFGGTNCQLWQINPVNPLLDWQGNYEIVCKISNKSMTVPACSNNDSGLTQWGRGYNLCQEWQLEQQAGGYYKIIKVTSGKVVTVPSGNQNPGVQVTQSAWAGADNQLWGVELVSGGDYKLISKSTGLVIEVSGGSTSNGAQLVINSYTGTNGQLWQLNPILTEATYKITNEKSQKVVDLPGCTTSDVDLQQWDWLDNDCQKWGVGRLSDGSYKFISVKSAKVFDLPNCSITEGMNICQSTDVGTDCQKWVLEYTGNGQFYMKSKSSGKYLQIEGKSTAGAAKLEQATFENDPSMRWGIADITNLLKAATVAQLPETEKEIVVYPNPTSSVLNIRGTEQYSVWVYSIQGALMLVRQKQSGNSTLDLSSFAKGTYFVKVSNNTKSVVKKVMVE